MGLAADNSLQSLRSCLYFEQGDDSDSVRCLRRPQALVHQDRHSPRVIGLALLRTRGGVISTKDSSAGVSAYSADLVVSVGEGPQQGSTEGNDRIFKDPLEGS